MIDMSIQNMSKSYFSNVIFENVTLEVKNHDRIALIGENGTGKTTLFKIITGIETPTSGECYIRKGVHIGYLKQIPDQFNDVNVEDVLMTSFKALLGMKDQMRILEHQMNEKPDESEALLAQYAELQMLYEVQGGYGIDEKMSKICDGLKMDAAFLKSDYQCLSGGEKSRVCLGKLLLEEPDVLLMDEPTNHLDLESIEWLEQLLNQFKGSVLLISHDRTFLDNVVNKIFELTPLGTENYTGNYSAYLKERVIRYEQRMKAYNNQQKKRRQMEDAIKRFKDWGRRGDNESMFKKARNMERRIERMDAIERPDLGKRKIALDFSAEDRSGKEVIVFKDYDLMIGERVLVKDIQLKVFYQEAVGLIGPNGSGKSTFIKALMDQTESEHGYAKLGTRISVGYLEQEIQFSDESQTILEYFAGVFALPENEARYELAKFHFYREDVFKKLSQLSGGERVRLRLAGLMRQDINLLILDEPTNHVDIKTKEVMEDALMNFNGTLFFISHDRYFLNTIADRIIEIDQGSIKSYRGNYDYYRSEKLKEIGARKQVEEENTRMVSSATRRVKKEGRKPNPLNIKRLEKEIQVLEQRLEGLNQQLSMLTSEFVEINRITDELSEVEKELELKFEEWYVLTES